MASPNAVQFNGSVHLSAGSLSGAVDSKQLIGSLWFKANTASTSYLLGSTSERAAVYFFGGSLWFLFRSTSGTDTFFGTRPSTAANDDMWHHLCFSTDGSDAACFFDDVQFSPSAATNNTLDFTVPAHAIGAHATGSAKFTGGLAQIYLNYGAFMDLTITANRRKLVGPGANSSINMGSDGSLVTGSPPILFFDGETDSWQVNKGTGGGFTKNGTLTAAAVLPPEYFVPPKICGAAILTAL